MYKPLYMYMYAYIYMDHCAHTCTCIYTENFTYSHVFM